MPDISLNGFSESQPVRVQKIKIKGKARNLLRFQTYMEKMLSDVNAKRIGNFWKLGGYIGNWYYKNGPVKVGSKGIKWGAKGVGAGLGVAGVATTASLGTLAIPVITVGVAIVALAGWVHKKATNPHWRKDIEAYYNVNLGGQDWWRYKGGNRVDIAVANDSIKLQHTNLKPLEILGEKQGGGKPSCNDGLSYLLDKGILKCIESARKLPKAQESSTNSMKALFNGVKQSHLKDKEFKNLFAQAAKDWSYFYRRTVRYRTVRVLLLHVAISWYARTEMAAQEADMVLKERFNQLKWVYEMNELS